MRYCSTRGQVNNRSFEEILFNNYTSNGGMFMPESVPNIDLKTLQQWSKLPYVEICKAITRLFISDEEIPTVDLDGKVNFTCLLFIKEFFLSSGHYHQLINIFGPQYHVKYHFEYTLGIITSAFTNVFDHEEIIPVQKVVGNVHVAELWHGPTLAFKDLALTCVAHFMEYFTKKNTRHVTIMVATSGDTGSAAIESVRRLKNIDIICMFPKGACSNVQELQMTTVLDDNVHVFAAEGNSDDLDVIIQGILKQQDLVQKYNLCTINSGNWARIMIQIVHYFYVYFQVCSNAGDEVHIIVPTGAMGNVTAGSIAYLMGLPIKITCTTNINDTVHRAITDGEYFPKETLITIAPAMDIQLPSNFERVIFLFSGTTEVQEFLSNYEKNGKCEVPQKARKQMSALLSSYSVSHEQMVNIMKKSWHEWNYLIDPHTATGMQFACNKNSASRSRCVVLSTAHMDKFLETLEMLNIEHQPSEKVQNLSKKPTKFKELTKGENWREIILNTISAIEENNKNMS